MTQTKVQSKLGFAFYRLATILKSFKALYSLPPEKVDAFVNSYTIYDYDWADEEQLIKDWGADYYKEIKKKIVDWYCVLNHLCAIGQVEKMYIPPAMDLSKSIIMNQKLFEKQMSQDLGMNKNSKVLDIGCGRGRVANHMARMTGASVTGINIDQEQLESARRFARGTGLANRCQFKYGDLNDIPFQFEDASFDNVYEIQAFSLSRNWEKLFKEINRILKPGGKFGCLEWVIYENYDAKNSHHADLMRQIKPLVGAIGNPTPQIYADALTKAGFTVLKNENASINGLQAPLIENADRFYTRTAGIINFLVRCKILPAHFITLFERLSRGGHTFIEADRLRLLSTSHYIVAQKN